MVNANRCARVAAFVATAALLVSCGGGGSGNGNNNAGVNAQACSINNPYRGDATAPISSGTIGTEKTWLRDYVDRNYLWYDKVPAVNANASVYSDDTLAGFYTSIDTYFLDLVRPLTNPAGKPVDRFSFAYPTAAWNALINSGSTVGYGTEWQILEPQNAPRSIRVAYVHAESQADIAGVRRGDTLLSADGVSADDTSQGARRRLGCCAAGSRTQSAIRRHSPRSSRC